MRIERCSRCGDEWIALRTSLWPEETAQTSRRDVERMLADPQRFVAFLAWDGDEAAGFAEGSIRGDYVNGCETSPVVFLEGIYVAPAHRRKGTARALCAAVEAWGRERACTEMGSDAYLDNSESHAMHAALGFEEAERVVYFRKRLD